MIGYSMCGCENWTIQKAERQRMDAFELWCWRRLESPLHARRSNQSILKEINPESSSEEVMLKLKLQCFSHLMQRASSLEKTLMLGKIECRRRRVQQNKMVEWQLIKTPGRDKSVSTYKLLWRFSSLPDRLVQPHVIAHSLPTVRGTRCFKPSKKQVL